MSSIFNYKTLQCELDKKTKSMKVFLTRPKSRNSLNTEVLFELESLLAWCGNKTEINTILFSSKEDYFSVGLDKEELKNWDYENINKFNNKLQKIVNAMSFLPQTVIFDLGDCTWNHALELSLGADIRVASQQTDLRFDFLTRGLVPSCGGVRLLEKLVGKSKAKYWILTAKRIEHTELTQSGLVHDTYTNNREFFINSLLNDLNKTAPIARMQAKRSLLESDIENMDHLSNKEAEFARAAHICEDWKIWAESFDSISSDDFTSPKVMSELINRMQDQA